jgi:hypothetical protein
MAQAKVFPPAFNVFNPPPVVAGGWQTTFPVYFHGDDVPGGYMVDVIIVDFADGDAAFTMDNKIRDAARVKGTARGIDVPLSGVISFAPPRRL